MTDPEIFARIGAVLNDPSLRVLRVDPGTGAVTMGTASDEGPDFERAVRELERSLDTGDVFHDDGSHAPNPTTVSIPLDTAPPTYLRLGPKQYFDSYRGVPIRPAPEWFVPVLTPVE